MKTLSFQRLSLRGLIVLSLLLVYTTGCKKDKEVISKNTVVITDNVTSETVWKNTVTGASKADYVISKDIQVSKKLTIEPGVVIHFKAGTALIILEEGSLIAKGSASEKIVFTGEEKINGFWRGILLLSNDVRNELDYVEVSYGGGSAVSANWLNQKANLALVRTSASAFGKLNFTNSVSTHSGGTGLYVAEGTELNTFSSNTFSANATTPVALPAQQVRKLDAATKYKGTNGKDMIQIIASTLKEPVEATWPAPTDGTSYLVSGDLLIESGLRIQEGARFEFESGKAMTVGTSSRNGPGYLIAKGRAAKKIVFTGENRTQPSWRGILFFSGDVRNEMDYVEVSYAGSSPVNGTWLNEKANIALASGVGSKLKLTNSSITNGGGWGVMVDRWYSTDAALTESSNTFTANAVGSINPG